MRFWSVYNSRQVMLHCSMVTLCVFCLSACSLSYQPPTPRDKVNTIAFSASDSNNPVSQRIVPREFRGDKDRSYGTIRMGFSGTEGARINLRRENRAYMAQVPIIEEEQFSTSFTAGHDSDHKFMTGLQCKWHF